MKDHLLKIKANQALMVEQLQQLCAINSGSTNLLGLKQIKQAIKHLFTPIADEIQDLSFPPQAIINMQGQTLEQNYGNALFIRKRPQLKRRILLSGHMDTVFGSDHPFQSFDYKDDNTLNGPGVADMKGGLLVILHALQAFETLELAQQIGWDLFINSDEELGSPASAKILEEIAPQYQAGLVYEPAMDKEGTLAKNRRGSGKFTLIAKGKAAHVGRAFAEGANAISYLAEAITAIDALNQKKEGITINIGKIAGGEALNVVPDLAVLKMDIRISQPEDEIWIQKRLQEIIKNLQRPNYQLTLEGGFSRPIKKVNSATERLFERIQILGKQIGIDIKWKDSGGCCDGNNLAKLGLPVIDTLGVRGGNIHSSDEYVLLDSLTERAALSFLILQDLANTGLEDLQK